MDSIFLEYNLHFISVVFEVIDIKPLRGYLLRFLFIFCSLIQNGSNMDNTYKRSAVRGLYCIDLTEPRIGFNI